MDRDSDAPGQLPPGIGVVRVSSDEPMDDLDHFKNFSQAFANALQNVGRAPGRYRINIELSGTVVIENPGHVVEYIVTLT